MNIIYKKYRNILNSSIDSFFQIMNNKIPDPQLVVFLKTDVERLQKNIRKRGRNYEQTISPDYLTRIKTSYEENLLKSNKYDKILIDTNGIDFVENQSDYEVISKQLKLAIGC